MSLAPSECFDKKLKEKRYLMNTYARLGVSFVKGRGSRLWDSEGKEYIDLISGIGVCVLGHCHPVVTEALKKQLEELWHTSNLYSIEKQAKFAKLLVENSFPGKVFFANSGAEANEAALKLARKFHRDKGKPRKKFVCLEGAFHGRSFATLSASGQPRKWEPFQPMMDGFVHVPPDDIHSLEEAIDDETAAVVLELIQGEGGVIPLSSSFIKRARELCDESGALLIVDEVQTGMGRTGKLFAWEHHGVVPDVMTLAKGLANGVPAAAVIGRGEFGDVFGPGDHGSTFGGNMLACAAGTATLQTIVANGLPDRAAKLGELIGEKLDMLASQSRLVKEVRGVGLMIAVELREPIAREVVKRCLKRGVLVNDVTPTAVRMLPPLIIEEEELDSGFECLREAILAIEL
ncbi:MAG: acetylornithine transaminase [Actinomycetota bacterium]|nr:acetylornithine transaminase [Actinomycetota bacterium]